MAEAESLPDQPFDTQEVLMLKAELRMLRVRHLKDLEIMKALRDQKMMLYAVVDRAIVDLSRLGQGPITIALPPRDEP